MLRWNVCIMHYDEKERLFRSPRRAKQIDSTTQMHSLFLVKDLFWDFVFSVPHTLRQGISCALDTENTAAFAQISGVFYRPSDAETIALRLFRCNRQRLCKRTPAPAKHRFCWPQVPENDPQCPWHSFSLAKAWNWHQEAHYIPCHFSCMVWWPPPETSH